MTNASARLLIACIAALCAVAIATTTEARVTRGPYLQTGTPTSVIVKWRSDLATIPRVVYGTSPEALTGSAGGANVNGHLEVALTGLQPGTVYYYKVQDGTALAGDATHRFRTAPPVGSRVPVRFWVTGDQGNSGAGPRSVANAFRGYSASRPADLWLALGDNAYNSGLDSEYQAGLFDTFPAELRSLVLWPTLGNHDGYSANSAAQTGPYYDIVSLPRNGEAGGVASGTEAYYSFDYANVHVVVLESFSVSRASDGPMAEWIRRDLQAASVRSGIDWIIAMWHHPPYSFGSHNSDTEIELVEMRRNIVPILEQYGVDLVLSGHSHGYERSFLVNGHHGGSGSLTSAMVLDRSSGGGASPYRKARGPYGGTVYAVAGASGFVNPTIGRHPVMATARAELGSMVIDIDGNRLDAIYLRENGAVVDAFSILKGTTVVDPGPGTGTGAGAVDLELAWSAPAPVNPGQYRTATATLTVRNAGTASATGVEIALPPPVDFRYASGRASSGEFFAWGDYTWRIATLAAGQSATLDLTVFTMTASAQTLFAQVAKAIGVDRDSAPGNGAAPAPREDDEAALVINAAGNPPQGCTPPAARITAAPASGMAPLSVTFTDASTGAIARNWSFPGGAPETATASTVTVRYASPGTYAAALVASAAGGCTAIASTGIAVSAPAVANGPDLELSFSAPAPVRPGQYGTFATTLTVRNAGTAAANGVEVVLPYPADLRHVAGAASQGQFAHWADYRWSIGTVAPGATASLQLTLFTMSAAPQTLFAQVLRMNEVDRDSTPGNGRTPLPVEDDEAAVLVNP